MNTEEAKKHFNNAYALCPWHVAPHVQEWLIKQMEDYHQAQLKLLGIANVVEQSELLPNVQCTVCGRTQEQMLKYKCTSSACPH